jgi:hypothetical protein
MIFSGVIIIKVIVETALTLLRSKRVTGGITAGSKVCRG